MAPGRWPSSYAARPAPGLPRYQRTSTMTGGRSLATHSASRSTETSGDRSDSIAVEATAEPGAAMRRLAAVPQPKRHHSLATGLALLFLVSLAGCQAAASLSLTNREFLSTGIVDGGAAFDLVPGTRVRLTFADTSLSASAGCNTFGASYR